MSDLLEILFAIIALACGFVFGRRAERNHYTRIRAREAELAHIPVRADFGFDPQAREAKMVMGNVVIANDRFKTLVASLNSFFGGRLTSLESLVDRGRREAVIRLKANAAAWGAKEIVHLRIDSSVLDRQGVEIFASATAIK